MLSIDPYNWLKHQGLLIWKLISCNIIFNIINTICVILQAFLLAHIIEDLYIKQFLLNKVYLLLLSFIFLIIIRAIIGIIISLYQFKSGSRIRSIIRIKIMHKLIKYGPKYTYNYSNLGSLSSTIINNVESLQGFYAYYLPQLVISIISPLIIFVVICKISYICALILLFTAPLIPLFMVLIGKNISKLTIKNFDQLKYMSGYFADIIYGLSILKLFGQSKKQIKKIFFISEKYRKLSTEILQIAFLSSSILDFFSSLSIAILATLLGLNLLHYINIINHITLNIALFILILAPEFYKPLSELNIYYHIKGNAIGAAKELILLTNINYKNININKINIDIFQENIVIKNMYIMSKENKQILSNINYKILKNKKIAIIGHTGSGKTTLINTLMGFSDIKKGNIFIDKHNINQINLISWRKNISWLGQKHKLFYGSILDNLLLANNNANLHDIWLALKYAGINNFIESLPNGINTIIHDNNQGISGGQSQRLALARMYLKNAPIWILDEPTTNLDYIHEELIFNKLYSINKTVIVVTHCIDYLKKMDDIIVLNKGHIVQSGNFSTLLQEDGIFAKMLNIKNKPI